MSEPALDCCGNLRTEVLLARRLTQPHLILSRNKRRFQQGCDNRHVQSLPETRRSPLPPWDPTFSGGLFFASSEESVGGLPKVHQTISASASGYGSSQGISKTRDFLTHGLLRPMVVLQRSIPSNLPPHRRPRPCDLVMRSFPRDSPVCRS